MVPSLFDSDLVPCSLVGDWLGEKEAIDLNWRERRDSCRGGLNCCTAHESDFASLLGEAVRDMIRDSRRSAGGNPLKLLTCVGMKVPEEVGPPALMMLGDEMRTSWTGAHGAGRAEVPLLLLSPRSLKL